MNTHKPIICLVAATLAVGVSPVHAAPAPQPNAHDFYVRAGQAITGDNPGTPSAVTIPKTLAEDVALERAYVAKNARAFDLLHEGFRYEYRTPVVNAANPDFGYYARIRQMARLLVQQGRVRTADGDLSGAVESYLDIVRLGTDSGRGSALIGMLSGSGIAAMGRSDLYELLDLLNAAQAKAAARRLESILARMAPYSENVRVERRQGVSVMHDLMASSEWKKLRRHKRLTPAEVKEVDPKIVNEIKRMQHLSDAQLAAAYNSHTDALVAYFKLPYQEHASWKKSPPQNLDPISSLFTDEFGNQILPESYAHWSSTLANDNLLLAALALRAYRCEHGAYPAALKALVPGYMASVPQDPYAANRPMRYQLTGATYLLYSIGPDQVDNGGKPATNFHSSSQLHALPSGKQTPNGVPPDAQGDIVSGHNHHHIPRGGDTIPNPG